MQVFYGLEALPENFKSAVVTLGVFDGLHRAHMAIIQKVIDSAKAAHSYSMLVTFDPHPRKYLNSSIGDTVLLLTPPEEKVHLLEGTALDAVLFLKTDKTLMDMGSEEFVGKILVNQIGVKKIIVGYDYHFGKQREGRAEHLVDLGRRYGFSVEIIAPIQFENEAVRSSVIRSLLSEGKVKKAANLIGRNYSVSGAVAHGAGRGMVLDFPTANIEINNRDKMLPKDGVYLTKVKVNGKRYFGICNIGVRKTFDEHDRIVEVHILNVPDIDLYGAVVEIDFLERLRDELKFETVESLKHQMINDEKVCLEKIKEYNLLKGGLT
ncbi:MAG: bifunctional riboflavin kinase/FAD synthetase [Candidatus Marinimicrobia bacterium]|nr:bifunctional riboflavin kinase/FAD synthetase [Candidatus Neomarinimicrobiota bacterium]